MVFFDKYTVKQLVFQVLGIPLSPIQASAAGGGF